MAKKTNITSRAAFETHIDIIVKKAVELARLEAIRDAEILKITERHKGPIEALKKEIKDQHDGVKKYAKNNRGDLFPDKNKKSVNTQTATYGFRTSPESIKLLGKTFDEERCILLLKVEKLGAYVRQVEAIDREGILAQYRADKADDRKPEEKKLSDERLATCGLKVVSEEKFFVEPLTESGDRVAA